MARKNCFTNFVTETHYANILPEPETVDIADSATLKPVTVRLLPEMIGTLDNLALKLGVSRQKLLFEMIDGGISAALDAIAQVEADTRVGRPDHQDQEASQAFFEEMRLEVIKEICE